MVLILDINLLSSFHKCLSLTVNVSIFIVYGGSLQWIQPQCAEAYDKLPSMVSSQPIICFLNLDCNKCLQVGTSLAYWFFCNLKLEENYFHSTIQLDETNIFLSRILHRFHKNQ